MLWEAYQCMHMKITLAASDHQKTQQIRAHFQHIMHIMSVLLPGIHYLHRSPMQSQRLTSPAAQGIAGMRRQEVSPVTSMTSFHHLHPSSLWTNTSALGRDLSEVHHLQRNGNYVAARLLKPQNSLPLWLVEHAELKGCSYCFVLKTTLQRGEGCHCYWCSGKSWGNWQCKLENKINLEYVPFITGLFILVNIKQKQQQNQELASSHRPTCDYRFSYIDKFIYNGCHWRVMRMSVSKKYGYESHLIPLDLIHT